MIPRRLHSLSNIDPDRRSAECALCGRVDLYAKRDRSKERFVCARSVRDRMTKFKRVNGSIPLVETQSRQHILSDIDAERQTALCKQCGPIPIRPSYGKRGIGYRCRKADRNAALGKSAKYWRRFRYGLTDEMFNALLAKQDYKCAICPTSLCDNGEGRNDNNRLQVDHCHKTGAIRGLLCGRCNTGLGRFCDDPALLRGAIKYLCDHESLSQSVVRMRGPRTDTSPTPRGQCSA